MNFFGTLRLVLFVTACFAAIFTSIGPLLSARGVAMARTPEERNLLVDFGEIPDPPEPPDVGIAIRLDSPTIKPSKPVFLSGSFSADGALLTLCKGDISFSISLTLVRVDKLKSTTLPLAVPTIASEPPPAGEYGPYFRRGGQFRLDLREFFEIPDEPGIYTIEASLKSYSSGPKHFTVGLP